MAKPLRFEDYDISEETGFAVELPDSLPEYYRPWHELADKTIKLLESRTMRQETLKLPQLDSTELKSTKDLKLAHLQLTVITAGYAWEQGPTGLPQSLPACIAVPLCDVADKLGAQAGMSLIDIMGNWQRIDKDKPHTKDNIKERYMLKGGQQFVNFLVLGVYTEIFFSKALPAVRALLEGSKVRDYAKVTAGLKDLNQWVKELTTLSKGFHQAMEADVFFREIISVLRGFNETSHMPEGMLYEGVTNRPRRIVLNSAASQSTIFQIIDALLRVEHPQAQQEFFKSVRVSWTSKYREFLELLESWPGDVREMAMKGTDSEMTAAYNDTVETVKQFRSYHLQLVTKFMIIPNKRVRAELNLPDPDPFAGIMPLLKGARDVLTNVKV